MWQEVWTTIQADFSDLPDVAGATRIILRLLIAALLAGLLGYQREQAGKAAGLRTHMLVGLGAALFVMIPEQAGMPIGDLSRVLQGVITGIGFLGAGAILKLTEPGQIYGLTTAAGIWLTAAIGIAAGMGRETSAVMATLLAFGILYLIPHVKSRAEDDGTPQYGHDENDEHPSASQKLRKLA